MDYLSNVLDNFTQTIGGNLSGALAAILIIIIGWFIAGLLKRIVSKLLKRTGVYEKLKNSKISISKFISKLVYFLVMIFVFTLALDKLGMSNVLDPFKEYVK